MYVIYWQNFCCQPVSHFWFQITRPSPGLGCIHIKWLGIIYFRNDRLEKMCFAHEKWNPTAHQVSCFLEILLFPFSLYFHFFFLSLKFLERIQIQIRKHLATHSQSWGCLRQHSQGRERKELLSQLTLYMALGSPASKERGVNTHFAGSAGLGELAKKGSHPEGVRMLEHDHLLSWCWTLSSPLFVFPPGSFYPAQYYINEPNPVSVWEAQPLWMSWWTGCLLRVGLPMEKLGY